MLDDDDLCDYLDFVNKCKNIIVVLQACYSGGFIPDIVNKFRKTGIIVCTSTSEDEISTFRAPPNSYGIYNHAFNNALKTESVEKAHKEGEKELKDKKWKPPLPDKPQIWDKDKEPKSLKCPGTGSSTNHYRIWRDGVPGPEQVGELNEPVSFELTEPGEYIIEYWAVDDLGNEEEHHFQPHTVEISIYPTDDSFTDERIPYRNYGSANTLWVYNSSGWDRYMWLKFDLSDVDAAALSSATLKLHTVTSSGTPRSCDRVFGVHLGEDGWDETSINWNSQPGMAVDPEDTVTNPPNFSVIEFDITDAVKSEAGGDGVLTVVIKSEEKCLTDFLSAYSKENPEDIRPYLEIK